MNKYEIIKKIEEFAPLENQESWDASGWIVDLPNAEVNKVMFALTVTPQVYEQAIHQGCDMIISHHPMFFVPFNFMTIKISNLMNTLYYHFWHFNCRILCQT